MNRTQIFSLLLFAAITSACTHDAVSDGFPMLDCNTEDITFSVTIQGILQNKCISCHNNTFVQGNITLEGYNNVKKYVDSGELIGSIHFAPGYSPMPKNQSKMASCDIEKIETWIDQGAPDN